MNPTPQFRLAVQTPEAGLYFETMPPMPVPRVGEDVFIPGDAFGYWTVTEVSWALPAKGAMEPTMEARLTVEWSSFNARPAPVYDEDRGWLQDQPLR